MQKIFQFSGLGGLTMNGTEQMRLYRQGGLSMDNEMTLTFLARSENEGLARMAVTSFIAQLDPTIDELSECKTIVSEAVSNAIIHGYAGNPNGIITVHAVRDGAVISVAIKDEWLRDC